ncbi:type I-E CRISPR-associated protein Cas7/Cse4/CasC [Arthrobacter halodurans]|uniref:Type I-E CRISPR-associated protein Cas7/Cse4/CasC n=1 Tax=Arthrobacter halodurans TaxID=516699 RepID=A0ABV4UQL3_9MICC
MRYLTLHIITPALWSDLDRNDPGAPRRETVAGAVREVLSGESLERGIRAQFEDASAVGERVGPANEGNAREDNLFDTEKHARSTDTSLSATNIETAAATIAGPRAGTFSGGERTGSLAAASFGRTYSDAPDQSTVPAIAVSPAVSTHQPDPEPRGSTFSSTFTSGVFYRSVTIDRTQLHANWSPAGPGDAAGELAAMVMALVYAVPACDRSENRPFTSAPLLVLAEEQHQPFAYSFDPPVRAAELGGYGGPTLASLRRQRETALRLRSHNFGLAAVAGTADGLAHLQATEGPLQSLVDTVVDGILKH